MTPVQLIESLLKGRPHNTAPTIPTNSRVGTTTHRIEIASSGDRYHIIYVGEIGVYIWPDTATTAKEVIVILYADPEFKTKLHQATP